MAEERMLSDEILLALIKKNSGGGNYNDLSNQPQVNGNTLVGNKSASDLGLQGTITAGTYIQKSGDTISVKRDISQEVDEVLTLTHDTSSGTNKVIAVLTVAGETIDSETYTTDGGTFHGMVQISFNPRAVRFMFTYLIASKTHSAGYEDYIYNEYTDTFVETIGEGDKLITKSEMDTAFATKADVVNYSTTEQKTGQKWIDGKDIYVKTFNAGALPASGNVTIPNNITNFGFVVNVETVGISNDGYSFANNGLVLSYANATSLVFRVTFDATGYDGYVTVYYTKTT